MATTQDHLSRLHVWVTFCCLVGLSLSFYTYYVEENKSRNKNYSALCDISERVSCSNVVTSRYGTGFGLLEYVVNKNSFLNQPNAIYGMIFYLIFPIIGYYNSYAHVGMQITLSIISNLMSLYLAGILYFVLHNFCIICVSTYVVNAFLLAFSLKKLSILKSSLKLKKAK